MPELPIPNTDEGRWEFWHRRASEGAMEMSELRVRLTCPSGCHCVFPDNPDMHECGCDGPCTSEAWESLRATLEEAHGV